MVEVWQKLGLEQRVAAVAALLLAVSTFGPFSAVEGAELLVAAGVLLLLRQRALGKDFHLPFSDGTVLVAAGAWSAVLITARLLDRPFGQNMLALACAALLIAAGARLRIKHPPAPEDEPIEWDHSPAPQRKDPPRPPRPPRPRGPRSAARPGKPPPATAAAEAQTRRIPAEEEPTEHFAGDDEHATERIAAEDGPPSERTAAEDEPPVERLPADEDQTEPLPPPEFDPPRGR